MLNCRTVDIPTTNSEWGKVPKIPTYWQHVPVRVDTFIMTRLLCVYDIGLIKYWGAW